MIKFEIIKNAMDSNKDYYEGISLDAVDQLHEIEASFNTEEEALEAIKDYESTFECGRPKNHIVEYFIEVNEYDEDGEWVSGGDIVEFAKLMDEGKELVMEKEFIKNWHEEMEYARETGN